MELRLKLPLLELLPMLPFSWYQVHVLLFLVNCCIIFYVGLRSSYQTESIGRDGQYHHFEKPWFSNFIMFFGMTFLFFKFEVFNDSSVFYHRSLLVRMKRKSRKILNQRRNYCILLYLFIVICRHSENRRPDKRVYYKVFSPAFCDFFASFIMFVGLLWIPISIWQMIRSSIILFTGLIRQFWLKKPLKKSEWWALIVIFFSLLVVGSAYFSISFFN